MAAAPPAPAAAAAAQQLRAAHGEAADAGVGDLLVARDDAYGAGGVLIDADALPSDPAVFADALERSVQAWRAAGKKGLWLKVPLSKAALVGPAADEARGGFAFHHAETDYVMMTRWLPQGAPSTLPPNASHQVGVGAFVVNERREVLVVQEALGPLKGKQVWKMPTGLVHQGEDLLAAVEREVWEETGVRAAFGAVLCMRQAHGFAFGKSDVFYCIGLHTTEPGQQPRPCIEIEAVRWMPLEEYVGQHFQRGVPLYEEMLDRCVAWAEGRYSGWRGAKLQAGMWGRERMDTLLWGRDDGEAAEAGVGGPGAGARRSEAAATAAAAADSPDGSGARPAAL
ncbi:nudix hydrolase [Raphidocelis subcapitata]|uniref:Nudix hydrolase n=1 Tax=Raphidocelis subcapitata TaxID=307507 RepID=A0A2V0NUB0_9CHLO|nr:nudix hydrolase [Raphidocelis subcapitata]|eukprot:GBF88517.1 nudix hydrolase [Raphidocelis subcapitata]